MSELDISQYEVILAASDGDPLPLIRILAGRVARLTIEKEYLEAKCDDYDTTLSQIKAEHKTALESLAKRVEAMETVHKMGRGIAIAFPVIGAAVTFYLAKIAPWMRNGTP